MLWKTVEYPGYLGKRRDEVEKMWDSKYGKGNWRIMYEWGGKIIERIFAIQLYEDAYYEYLKFNKDILDWLINTASDIYDTAPTNVQAKFSYNIQETSNNHIHDVSIRKSVARIGTWFKGDHLVHVRDETTEGFRLNPGYVTFHLPDLISKEPIQDYGNKGQWWEDGSIEDFYQKNKILQIKK